MSGYQSFALAGAGEFGDLIIDELLKIKSNGKITSVSVIIRKSSPTTVASGAELRKVDYANHSALTESLRGIDVLISVIGRNSIGQQIPLLDAAKAAGVKIYVPSEFGIATKGLDLSLPVVGQKLKVQDHATKIGLPYTLFWTGIFAGYVPTPPLGWDLHNGKAVIGGDGKHPISITKEEDIARFLAYVFTTFPKEQLENRVFKIEGERISPNEIISAYEAKTGKKIDVTYVPANEVEAEWKSDTSNFIAFLKSEWANGRGTITKSTDELDNSVWPEWEPKKVIDAIV